MGSGSSGVVESGVVFRVVSIVFIFIFNICMSIGVLNRGDGLRRTEDLSRRAQLRLSWYWHGLPLSQDHSAAGGQGSGWVSIKKKHSL